MKRFFMVLFYIFIGLLVFTLGYFAADAVLSRITINKPVAGATDKPIEAYILSNGVHTDIVLPLYGQNQDWNELFPFQNTKGKDSDQQWISIGWGDKGFYLNTPEWKDLTLKTALVAGSGTGESALHITYYKNMVQDSLCRKVWIDSSQYQALRDYILQSADLDANGKPILVQTNAQYGNDDAFYEAKGAYHLFYSCNTWANNALKKAGMPAAKWTVFDKGILRHYPY